jgi:hypothetical protein
VPATLVPASIPDPADRSSPQLMFLLWPAERGTGKFTLSPGTDIWDLAVTTHQHVRAGAISGWICEHGNDGGFTQGDYTNHLYAITRPASERGLHRIHANSRTGRETC